MPVQTMNQIQNSISRVEKQWLLALISSLALLASVLFGFSVASSAQKKNVAAPEILIEGKDEPGGLTFRWTIEERGGPIRSVSVLVRKDGAMLRSATTTKTTGTYFVTPYSAGKFSLEIRAVSAGNVASQKELVIQTKGNQPSPCPSRPVWAPPSSNVQIKGLVGFGLRDLIRQSSLIIAGKVIDIQFCQTSGNSIPFTFVTFSQLNVIHGKYSSSELTLSHAGGLMNGEISDFAEMPKFNRNDRFLLFLTARNKYHLTPIVGWSQGVLLSDNEGIKTFSGQPVIGISEKDQELVVGSDVPAVIRPVDPLYGVHKVMAGAKSEPRSGPPGREIKPQPVTGTPMSEAAFARDLQSMIRLLSVSPPAEGRLLPPGTPFELKFVRAGTSPRARKATTKPQ